MTDATRPITEAEMEEMTRGAIDALVAENARLRAEVARQNALLTRIDNTLRVPAAEYVPAIQDVFKLIDEERNR